MHASVGREVQLNRVSSVLTSQLSPSPHDTRRQDLRDLIEALGCGHETRREGVDARKGVIEIMDTETCARAHPVAARSRYSVSLWGDAPELRLRWIQPQTVSGSLSSARAMSSSDRPSPWRRTASACRLRYALVRQGVEQ